jgi:CheY-like chemotaxis protein
MSPNCVIGESDPFLTLLLERYAKASGMPVLHARLGEQVLQLLRGSHPDVLVIDPELPGAMRGWEVIQAVQADPELCGVDLITCGWLDESDTRALTGVVAPHLQKPELSYDDFQAALKNTGLHPPAPLPVEHRAQPADSARNQ